MPITHLATATRNNIVNNSLDELNGGTIEIYGTPMPASANDVVGAATLLAVLTFANPAFGDPAAGQVAANAITRDDDAAAGGAAVWARLKRSDASTWGDVDVTDEAGTGVIKMVTTTIVAGQPVEITSMTWTAPSGE